VRRYSDGPDVRLFLLRHAKSDRAAGKTVEDHERPLNARGRAAAQRVGAYMASTHYLPERVLCSTALRTRETLDLVLPHLSPRPGVTHTRNLYLATWPALLAQVQKTPESVRSLLLVGHNPGMEQLAVAFALNPKLPGEQARGETLAEKFPTAALAVFDFDAAGWRDIKPGEGRLVDFVRPKEIPDEDGA
jgi:phosphohistidine phosphatase